jgi:hypothetical protein
MSLIPPFNVDPIEIDKKTGRSRWNRDWWLFLHGMWEQAGGTSDISDSEALGMSHRRRGPQRSVPELVPPRAQRGRKPDEAAPPRHSFPRLLLIKESYKPLTLIRLYAGASADIPTGWQLADGTNGTPDMRDKFVVGAGNLYPQGSVGGSTTIAANNLPAHTHPYNDKDTTYTANTVAVQSGTGTTVVQSLTVGGGDTARTSGNNTTTATAYLPPYYATAYIINTKTVTIVTDAKLR